MIRNLPVITDRKIRIGVVGCGRISKNHLEAIHTFCDDFDLVAVCDIDARALDALELDHKVTKFDDLNEMLVTENLDVITICTPSGLHADQTIMAAEYGVNIICEKPMATRYMGWFAYGKGLRSSECQVVCRQAKSFKPNTSTAQVCCL